MINAKLTILIWYCGYMKVCLRQGKRMLFLKLS
jgi:hypothetical protein